MNTFMNMTTFYIPKISTQNQLMIKKYLVKESHLSISQQRGLMTSILKKNQTKPQQFLKNWKPISLLNCDYKIAAKAVVSRMKRVLSDIKKTVIKQNSRMFRVCYYLWILKRHFIPWNGDF